MLILLGSYTVSMGYFMGIFLDGAITNEMISWAPVNMAGTSQQENDGWEAIDFTVNFPQSKGVQKGTLLGLRVMFLGYWDNQGDVIFRFVLEDGKGQSNHGQADFLGGNGDESLRELGFRIEGHFQYKP